MPDRPSARAMAKPSFSHPKTSGLRARYSGLGLSVLLQLLLPPGMLRLTKSTGPSRNLACSGVCSDWRTSASFLRPSDWSFGQNRLRNLDRRSSGS